MKKEAYVQGILQKCLRYFIHSFFYSLIHSVLYSTDIYGAHPIHKTQQLVTAKYTKMNVTGPLPLINITLFGTEFELPCNWW